MPLHLIIGPMKSGKSLELIAQVAPYSFSNVSVSFFQPKRNVRDNHIQSRNGTKTRAIKVSSLADITDVPKVIGIDEIHMFPETDISIIHDWLNSGKHIYASGLDLDYRGKLISIISSLLELKPETINLKKAVCDKCRKYSAVYTQILKGDIPVTSGLDSVVPDDGTYVYEARCRNCFVYKV